MAPPSEWLNGRVGFLPPVEQAKLWALRVVLRMRGEKAEQYQWMGQQVALSGGGHPGRDAVRRFFARVDADPEWHPGKKTNVGGRPPVLTLGKRKRLAASAQALKKRGVEPCYDALVAQCPALTLNPQTQVPLSRQRVNQVLTRDCYDDGAAKPWQFMYGARRRPLSAAAQAERLAWARRLLRGDEDAAWMYRNVVWVDFCSKVIPGSERRALDQEAAGRNKRKRLMSPDAATRSANLGGSDTAVKQASFGDVRVWYFVAMTRGVLGVTCFANARAFPGETQRGAYLAIKELPKLLGRMLGRSAVKPKVVFSDRGPGFYNPRYGVITSDYDAALRSFGFEPWAGTHALQGPRRQPGDVADILLHETAISWLKQRLAKSDALVKRAWQETPAQFAERLAAAAGDVNATCSVEDLCRSWRKRLQELVQNRGDRLRH